MSADINWGKPDAVISTQSLSDLPKDILKQPMLKEILTEDFAFYYLDSAEYLSLKGSLKRIAFEYDMTVFDEIVNYVMNKPAEVIFWKKENGRLDDYMISIERSSLLDLLTLVAKVSAPDKQLTKYEERTEGQDKFTVYKLKYGQHNELYFTNLGTKLIVYTHPRMPMPTAQRLKSWLNDDFFPSAESQGSFLSKLTEKEVLKNKHQIYFNMNFLTFGYQKYLTYMDYLAFSFNDQEQWRTHGLFGGEGASAALNTNELWKAVPRAPAMCLSFPINHQAIQDLFTKTFEAKQKDIVINTFDNNIGLCWFADSKFYTPVYVLKTKGPVDKEFLKTAFNLTVSHSKDPKKSVPVEVIAQKESLSLVRFVPSSYGDASTSKKDGKKGFKTKLTSINNYLLFSADSNLVDQSISVINKKSPALAEGITDKGNVAGVLFPKNFSALMKKSIKESLSGNGDIFFKEAVTKRFFPRLDKMNSMPNLSLEWPKNSIGTNKKWEELIWVKFTSK